MKRPHHKTVDKHWEIAKRALMISYALARGEGAPCDADYEEALESVKQLFAWGKEAQDNIK